MAKIEIDYREVEIRVLRRYLKAMTFRQRYGAGSAERAPVLPVSGRMTVSQPPLHFLPRERNDPRIL
jgi:hypothetical protein